MTNLKVDEDKYLMMLAEAGAGFEGDIEEYYCFKGALFMVDAIASLSDEKKEVYGL